MHGGEVVRCRRVRAIAETQDPVPPAVADDLDPYVRRGGADQIEHEADDLCHLDHCEEPVGLLSVFLHRDCEIGEEPEDETAEIDEHGPWHRFEGIVDRQRDIPVMEIPREESGALICDLVGTDGQR